VESTVRVLIEITVHDWLELGPETCTSSPPDTQKMVPAAARWQEL
jgi:hypothetical protein